jgi:hypothetical protein
VDWTWARHTLVLGLFVIALGIAILLSAKW